MITGKIVSFDMTKEGANCVFEKTTASQLGMELDNFLKGEKYKLEKGTAEDGIYGRGNAVLRILLGAFIPRYKFNIKIVDNPDRKTQLQFLKGMSGASGGMIGASKMKKETTRLLEKLRTMCQ
jgi:hypothetical protein